MPTFSFIIPVKPDGAVKALAPLHLLNEQEYPFEVLVAEGTRPSRQRNMAAGRSQGDILFFLDDDSLITADCLALCAQALKDPAVAVVGGPSLTPDSDTRLQHLFAFALSSPFGAGAMRNRYRATGQPRETSERELILCNLAIRRDAYLKEGGLDERLYPNEENELLDRISSSGHKLVHVPSMGVERSQRQTIRAFTRQMFTYGRGRAQQTLLAGLRSPMSLLPLMFVAYLAILPMLPSSIWWSIPLIAYVMGDLIFTAAAVISSRAPTACFLMFIFPLMHCTNGIGLLLGFCGGKPVPKPDCDVLIRQIKEFGQTNW